MSYFPDLGRKSMFAAGEHVRAIGWLHPDYPYTKGKVSAAFVRRLKRFAARSGESASALCLVLAMGFHTCEFCGKSRGHRNFGVPNDDVLFVAPEMIVHYVKQHGYAPPAEFIAAVLSSPLPGTPEYREIVEKFRPMHIRFLEELRRR
jgi:hypothetical protein